MISVDRIIEKLDEYLNKNDYVGAEKHLLYWRAESELCRDYKAELLVCNELMGLYRKLSRREEALSCVDAALSKINALGIEGQVGAATTFLNSATVYKAFGEPQRSIELFECARAVYESELDEDDSRLGGLYNNMALTLVDLGRYREADAAYLKAVSIMEKNEGGALEVAITYLNMASAAEIELGLLDADEKIQALMDKAQEILDTYKKRDGYYAFVCEKCASVFRYYGRFFYADDLEDRARRAYSGEGN